MEMCLNRLLAILYQAAYLSKAGVSHLEVWVKHPREYKLLSQ